MTQERTRIFHDLVFLFSVSTLFRCWAKRNSCSARWAGNFFLPLWLMAVVSRHNPYFILELVIKARPSGVFVCVFPSFPFARNPGSVFCFGAPFFGLVAVFCSGFGRFLVRSRVLLGFSVAFLLCLLCCLAFLHLLSRERALAGKPAAMVPDPPPVVN